MKDGEITKRLLKYSKPYYKRKRQEEEIKNMKEILKKINLMVKEQNIMKMEIKNMKEILKKINIMEKELNIIRMEIKNMKDIGKKVK